jgi:hypothetical protein
MSANNSSGCPLTAYASQHFHYDRAAHTVTCPQGHNLDHEGHTRKEGAGVERFRCHRRDCPVRTLCTGDPKGRQIEIRPHREEVQAMRRRLQDPDWRALWEQRSRIIEPRFGQIKQHDGFRRWTVWGLEGVKTQPCRHLAPASRWATRGASAPGEQRKCRLGEAGLSAVRKVPDNS